MNEVDYICLHKGTFYGFTCLFSSQNYVTFGIKFSFGLTLQGSTHSNITNIPQTLRLVSKQNSAYVLPPRIFAAICPQFVFVHYQVIFL